MISVKWDLKEMDIEKLEVLKTVPRDKAFYFFTSIGNYTGKSAASLEEFLQMVRDVNVKSLEFHLYRGDFEKWLNEVFGVQELAEELKKLRTSNLFGEQLRSCIYSVVESYLKRLKEHGAQH
jgi:MoaA/NifB/PqqE/SkfB family radical SAM enzyme